MDLRSFAQSVDHTKTPLNPVHHFAHWGFWLTGARKVFELEPRRPQTKSARGEYLYAQQDCKNWICHNVRRSHRSRVCGSRPDSSRTGAGGQTR
jgi:hypothetical protein